MFIFWNDSSETMRWVLIGSGLIATGLMVRAMVWMGRKLKRDEPRVGRTVDVFVMLPLNAAEMDLEVLTEQVRELKKIGVKGVMMDFWWSKVRQRGGFVCMFLASMRLILFFFCCSCFFF